jgi:hypothetical protein
MGKGLLGSILGPILGDGGGESAYNGRYVEATKIQAESNENVAKIQGKWDYKVAHDQSQAVIKQAELDLKARMYEADKNYAVQMKALEVREIEAKNQLKVDLANAKNDSIRAEAAMVSAKSDVLKANTKQYEAESDREKDRDKYGQREDYWYGNA